MKVLMLDGAGFSPPYDFSLIRGLEEAGATVRLIMPDAIRREWEEPDGLPASRQSNVAKTAKRMTKAVAYVALLREVRRMVEGWKPDVVHVQWLPLPLADRRLLQALRGRVPLVHTMHNTSLFHGGSGGIQGWGLPAALSCFDRVVVHSEYSRHAAQKLAMVHASKLRVIPHGAFDYYKRFSHDGVRPQGAVKLLFAGSIKHYKGLDVLIDALPTLEASVPRGSWHLTIAGHPSISVDSLRATVSGYGLDDHVSWSLRHQSERELGQLFGGADIVVLPYREIDQSGVLLAAVGMERAVVASAVGAFPELIRSEKHGLLVPPGDPTALGRALARLVANGELRIYCEEQMRYLAGESLHWSTIGRATIDMYQEITHP